jgi:hypothetical protein
MQPASLAVVLLVEPEGFEDKRGHFFESFHLQQFHHLSGRTASFVQDSHSRSMHGVLRGSACFGQWLGLSCCPPASGASCRPHSALPRASP